MAWTNEKNPFGQNRTPILMGWANDSSNTAVPLAADPATGRLLVNATGSSGGTSSTFGAAFPSTGTAVGASDGVNMQALQVDGSGNLKVTGGGGGTQYTDAGVPPAHPVGGTIEWNNAGAWATVGSAAPLPVSGTVTANAGTNLNTSALATSANQTNGAQLVKLFDGSNVGTIKAASTAAIATDTALVVAISPNNTVPVSLASNQSVNESQINGVAPLMGNGVTGTGSQRVTIASDNTAFSVNAVQSGTWNIGSITTLPTLANVTTVATVSTVTSLSQLAGAAINLGTGASSTGTLRVVEANDEGKTLKSAGGSASSSGNNTLVAAGTNKLKVYAFSLSTSSTVATTCIFQSGAGGTELWRVVLQAPTSVSTGANLAISPPASLFATAGATLLNLNLSGANTVHWSVSYFDEA